MRRSFYDVQIVKPGIGFSKDKFLGFGNSYNYPSSETICRVFAMWNYYFYLPLHVKISDN